MSFNNWFGTSAAAARADQVLQDAGYAWRGLRRSPGFALAAVLVLALGLGANAALFSVLDRLFLSIPAGVAAPQEIRRIYYRHPQWGFPGAARNSVYETATYTEYVAMRRALGTDTPLGIYDARIDSVDMRIDNASASAMVSYVSQSYFTILGVTPALGRFFTTDEDRVDIASPAAVISDALWRRVFGGERTALGKQVRIADRTYSVVGIAPRGFDGIDLDRADVWLPLAALPAPPALSHWYLGGAGWFRVIARVSSNAAQQRLTSVATVAYRRENATANERDTTSTIVTGPIHAALGPMDRSQEVSISLRLAGVSLILLLIAVGNVANLLLVRGMRRRREIAIRRALGVSAARLCWQLMSESLLVSTVGAAIAVIVAASGSKVLRRLLLPDAHWSSDTHLARLIVFTALVSVVAGALAGAAPVVQSRRVDLTTALKGGVPSGGPQRSWTRGALTIAQVALSIVLLVGAGLFTRSLRNVRAIDLGFEPDGLVVVHAGFPDLARSRAAAPELERIAMEMFRAPGVRRVAIASGAPMQGTISMRLFLPGRDSVPTVGGVPPSVVLVTPEYFGTVGIRVAAGRTFGSMDRAGTARRGRQQNDGRCRVAR